MQEDFSVFQDVASKLHKCYKCLKKGSVSLSRSRSVSDSHSPQPTGSSASHKHSEGVTSKICSKKRKISGQYLGFHHGTTARNWPDWTPANHPNLQRKPLQGSKIWIRPQGAGPLTEQVCQNISPIQINSHPDRLKRRESFIPILRFMADSLPANNNHLLGGRLGSTLLTGFCPHNLPRPRPTYGLSGNHWLLQNLNIWNLNFHLHIQFWKFRCPTPILLIPHNWLPFLTLLLLQLLWRGKDDL